MKKKAAKKERPPYYAKGWGVLTLTGVLVGRPWSRRREAATVLRVHGGLIGEPAEVIRIEVREIRPKRKTKP
jgi:hypothetical protein